MIGIWCGADFVEKIDAARGAISRSQFVRDALKELCGKNGVPVSEKSTLAPDRAGKGGPKKVSSDHGVLAQKKVAIRKRLAGRRRGAESSGPQPPGHSPEPGIAAS